MPYLLCSCDLALLTPVSWINSISHEILQVEQLGIVPVEPRLGKLGSVAKSIKRGNAGRLIRILTVNSTRVLPRRSSVEQEVNMNLWQWTIVTRKISHFL